MAGRGCGCVVVHVEITELCRLVCAVTVAKNGKEALDILHRNDKEKINLILTDIMMPEVTPSVLLETNHASCFPPFANVCALYPNDITTVPLTFGCGVNAGGWVASCP